MVDRRAGVITLRRSTVVRTGVAAGVLAALGIGIAIGLGLAQLQGVPTRSSAPPRRPLVEAPTTKAATIRLPTVMSCVPGSPPTTQPTIIYIGCAGGVFITSVRWSSWGMNGGSGSGTLNVSNCQDNCANQGATQSPAFVVVTDPVNGVFQDVLITPPGGTLTPQSSSKPGSVWGSG
jgi:hypothetical protein